ncbi:MAG TPA: conjugal transfer protein TraR [Gammaproteobacteria bacterium]|nr:conjugal transfer protein TraR [Gammaproteobacteria bacterium]
MSYLNEADLDQYRQRLLAYKEELEQEIHDKLVKEGTDESISLAGKVHDAQAESMSVALSQVNRGMLKMHLHDMKDLEMALERIESGEYGTCIDCEEPIAKARLDAYPMAKRCIKCQSLHEEGK